MYFKCDSKLTQPTPSKENFIKEPEYTHKKGTQLQLIKFYVLVSLCPSIHVSLFMEAKI